MNTLSTPCPAAADLFLVVLVAQVAGSFVYGGWWPLLWFLVLGPVLLVSVLVHELGHCAAARSVGGHADSILLWPLGGLAFIGHDRGPKGADMAGSGMHDSAFMDGWGEAFAPFKAALCTATRPMCDTGTAAAFISLNRTHCCCPPATTCTS